MDLPYRQARRRRRLEPTEILDDQSQEELIQQFQRDATNQSRLYRAIFSTVFVAPSPAFILIRYYRNHTKLALLSILSLGTAVYTLRRYNGPRAPIIRLLNLALGMLIALNAYVRMPSWSSADTLWLFPLGAAFTVVVIEYWLQQVDTEIKKLNGTRYELRGA